VLLLHGWPGDRHDQDAVAALLAADHDVVVPDFRGFGESPVDPALLPQAVGLDAQVAELATLLDALGLGGVVVGGYDVGSRVGQALARARPDLVRALVVAPPLPGVGERILSARAMTEYWYQAFHQLELAERLIDGRPEAARAYLEHFWTHWSGPGWTPEPERLDRLAALYGRPGAFTATISWYRAGAGSVARSLAERIPPLEARLATPTRVLWPAQDPLAPPELADRIGAFFTDVALELVPCGHFVPVEAPAAFAGAIRAA
jgi:pimeloyl-ACP methyl ester carboxylesterase